MFLRAPSMAGASLRLCPILLLFTFLATPASATCPQQAGIADVSIAYIDLDDDGTPDINTTDKKRNEHARISSALADQISLSVESAEKIYPQIRVILENHDIAPGHAGTGIFSVYEIFESTDDEIQVWADETAGDEDSGEYRLFEDTTVADITAIDATVYRQAVSLTETWLSGSYSSKEHFCEPDAGSSLKEIAVVEEDRRFALLVPHGGEVEFATSEQIEPIATALGAYGIAANSWDLPGYWHSGSEESEHWHITSKELTHDGFPGLTEMLSLPTFDSNRDFQYVASLHGMDFSKEGLVLGGRGSREAKCLIGSRIRERMAAEGLAIPAVYVWNYDGETANSVEVPHGDGTTEITDPSERGSDPGLSGLTSRNIVNRLSPNADGAVGFGGFQIEESQSLRAAGYRDMVATEIAHAFGEMITKPNLFAATGSPICDALLAGTPAPTAEIRGRAWWDDGSATRAGSEGPVAGVSVLLLDDFGAVLATATTSATGEYAFAGLADGTYAVRFEVSDVIDFAAKDQGGNDTVDSDADQTSGETDAIILVAHQLLESVDAGLLLASGSGSFGDFIWADDGDGKQSLIDPALDGVIVELFDDHGVRLETTASVGGFYSFFNLPAGDYIMRFTPPPGYSPTQPFAGQDESLDSNLDAKFEIVATSTGSGPGLETDLDAGFVLGCLDATPIAFGSEWKYSASAASDWREVDFLETGWNEEKLAPLGYGMTVETTIPDSGNTLYFRLFFELEEPSLFDSLELDLFAGDGAVVYLNEVEVGRSNVPIQGTGAQTTTHSIAQPTLVQGTNILAVEVHETSGALVFDLELSARICRPCVEKARIPSDRSTYLRENSTSNRGLETRIKIDADTPESGLLAWPTANLPQDAEILHAAVELKVTDESSNTFYIYPLNSAWDEATADWIHASDPAATNWTQPGALHPTLDHQRTEPLASFSFGEDAGSEGYTGVIVLNVSGRELVQAWARGERANHGILIPGEGPNDNKLTIDSDEGGQAPVLEVVYRSCSQ